MNMANAEEQKTYTPKETIQAFAEVPGKFGDFIKVEVEKTKKYQAEGLAEMKTKWPFTMFKGNQ